MYEVFEHTADLGLRVRAPTLEDLMSEAARGLFSLLVVNLEDVLPVQPFQFQVEGDEIDLLVFDWLTELLYVFETKHVLLCQFNVTKTEGGLQATAAGEPIDPARHQLDYEVKAVTYHQLQVQQDEQGWLAEVILDI